MDKKFVALILAAGMSVTALAADPPKDDKANADEKATKPEKRPWPPQKVPKVIDQSKPEPVGRKTQDERAAEKREKRANAGNTK